MSPESIQRALRDLSRAGELVKHRPYRQIWRIQVEDQACYLKFYPRLKGLQQAKRVLLGNPARREFSRLQQLQKANIPAPSAISVLVGFRIDEQPGDAVLMHAIEPGVTLDRYFSEMEGSGKSDPLRRWIAAQVIEIVQQLIRARLGHRDLHLGNFLLSEGKVYLLDAYALRRAPMRKSDLLMLGHGVRRYATKTELLRAWRQFGGGELPRADNRTSQRFWGKELSRTENENAYFGKLRDGDWSGFYFKTRKHPVPWSMVSSLRISENDWHTQWPRLLGQLKSQQFRTIKDTGSGQVLAGEMVLAGVPLSVIVKRPRRKYWHRYINEIGRGSRSRRAWRIAWSLIVRGIPTAWPILIMERRRFGYVVDQLIVSEQISGPPLARFALNELTRPERDRLFHRVGRLLRRMETLGLYHWDAKASNFMIQNDPVHGPSPILIDVDGIRKIRWTRSGIHRLLDSLREVQKAYNPADSYALCRGYAPAARMEQEA